VVAHAPIDGVELSFIEELGQEGAYADFVVVVLEPDVVLKDERDVVAVVDVLAEVDDGTLHFVGRDLAVFVLGVTSSDYLESDELTERSVAVQLLDLVVLLVVLEPLQLDYEDLRQLTEAHPGEQMVRGGGV
jgi:hypothetical protein